MKENQALKIIDAFGGLTKTSRALYSVGHVVSVSTVQGWKQSGRIPDWRQDALKRAAKKKKIELNPDIFGKAPKERATP